MFRAGSLLYTDTTRWLLDNGHTLTEVEWCPSWWRWWRITRHRGRERTIILDCLARSHAEQSPAGHAPPRTLRQRQEEWISAVAGPAPSGKS